MEELKQQTEGQATENQKPEKTDAERIRQLILNIGCFISNCATEALVHAYEKANDTDKRLMAEAMAHIICLQQLQDISLDKLSEYARNNILRFADTPTPDLFAGRQ